MIPASTFVRLIGAYIDGRLSAIEFETFYLALFKNSGDGWSEKEYELLQQLFGAVDRFCADPSLREDPFWDIGEEQLLEEATSVYKGLTAS